MSRPLPWRVGRSVHRTIYDADNILIGVMDTPELAAQAVAAVNREALREQVPEVRANRDRYDALRKEEMASLRDLATRHDSPWLVDFLRHRLAGCLWVEAIHAANINAADRERAEAYDRVISRDLHTGQPIPNLCPKDRYAATHLWEEGVYSPEEGGAWQPVGRVERGGIRVGLHERCARCCAVRVRR